RYVVLQVRYSLINGGAPSVRYADGQREFEGKNRPPTLEDVREHVLRVRARKAMLLVDGDPDCRSAGSFFKNPIVSESQFAHLQERAGPDIPRYPAKPSQVKPAAEWLIEHAVF